MTAFKAKSVCITGAGRGIGLEMALLAAERGARVWLVDRDPEALAVALARVRERIAHVATEPGSENQPHADMRGASVQGVVADITRDEDVARLAVTLRESGGGLDILINNAGIVHGGPFESVSVARHVQTFEVNVLGLLRVTHALLPLLRASPARDGAHLVNIASATGLVGVPYASSYAASKWAVIGLSESLRLELKQLGVQNLRVTTVCPSTVDTGLFAGTQPPRFMPMLYPAPLARQIVRAVERNKVFVMAPWFVNLIPLTKILPVPLQDFIQRILKVNSAMSHWRGR